jgi:hypothetical protein
VIFQENRPAVHYATPPPAQVSLTPARISSAIVAALGGFLFGFDTAVISGTTGALKATYHLDENSLGFTVGSCHRIIEWLSQAQADQEFRATGPLLRISLPRIELRRSFNDPMTRPLHKPF